MSKTAIIIMVIVALIIIIIVYSMYKSAKAKALALQQQQYNTQYSGTSSQKVNVAAIGNFLGGVLTGLKTNADASTASGTTSTAPKAVV